MKTHELRQAFLDFYASKGHVIVPGASTIPSGDATILFTIAGMTQFKDILAGTMPRKFARVANSQKCIRAADLEDVGLDGRHLTMFEMLGIWSFGDYFKKESIAWSYEFISKNLKLDLNHIWVSVHESDTDAAEIWRSMGIPAERIVKLGDKDNFWSMGPTGPCGPCTEIYFDQGPSVGCSAGQGPTPGAVCKGPGCDCDRYLEFWNNVFMEFNRDENGKLHPLPAKNVDTGVGLERLAAICQKKTSAYETDAFSSLQHAVCHKSGLGAKVTLDQLILPDRQSVQVISDHMRTLVVTLSDGATFSNEGRGYVLRRILRRAVRYANRLQENHGIATDTPFLFSLVSDVGASLGNFYPDLLSEVERVSELVREEENRFLKTLAVGMKLFRDRAKSLLAASKQSSGSKKVTFPGEDIFILHDSYGFPSDLTALLCREEGIEADLKAFEREMEQQKNRSRKGSRFYDSDGGVFIELNSGESGKASEPSEFSGYVLHAPTVANPLPQQNGPWHDPSHAASYSPVRAGAANALRYKQSSAGSSHQLEVIFQSSPFYPEGGGQLADKGYILFDNGTVFEVENVQKSAHGTIHCLRLEDTPSQSATKASHSAAFSAGLLGTPHTFLVNMNNRLNTARNHTATHLLHAALRTVLGTHVRQAGSQVGADGLRFDFSHPRAMTDSEREAVEALVIKGIQDSFAVTTHEHVALENAKKMGALAMFDEKYDDHVRVLEIGPVSMELCGGTHVTNTAQIGAFSITSESSVTTGVRRIEAITGSAYLSKAKNNGLALESIAAVLKCPVPEVPARVESIREHERALLRKIEELEQKLANQASTELENQSQEIVPGLRFLAHNLGRLDSPAALETLGDALKQRTKGVVVVAGIHDEKAQLLVTIHADAIKQHPKLSAGTLMRELAPMVGGRGGGKPEFAKGGGSNIDALAQALEKAKTLSMALANGE
jgi:alanyl-tRNA synthetase